MPRISAAGAGAAAGQPVQRDDRARRRNVPSVAEEPSPAGSRAPAVADQAPDARIEPTGGADLEEGDSCDQSRAEQLAGADLLARAFRARARAPRRSGAAHAGV